jgi:Tfp pilus assembly protein PilF
MRHPQTDHALLLAPYRKPRTSCYLSRREDDPEVLTTMKKLCLIRNSGLLVILCAFLASTVAGLGAQTVPSHAVIRDHLRKAAEYLTANDPNSAAQEFQAVLAIDPKNIDARINLGLVEMSRGNCQAASQDFRRALETQPALIKAKALLGICDRRMGDRSAQGLLESSFAKLTDTKLRTQVGMELVDLHYQRGDPEGAVPVVQKLVDLNPDNADVLFLAQRLYTELADDTLNKLAFVAPGSARIQQVIAERLVNAGDLPNAILHYKQALAIDPHLRGIHFELAEAILESAPSNPDGQADARKELEAALRMEGDSARTECLLARIELLQDHLNQAFTRYSKALKLDPNNVQADMGLGRVLMTREKYEDALNYLRMAIAADPLNTEAHYRLATVYRMLEKPGESEKEMKLFQEIKQTRDHVRTLYRQMNKRSQPEEGDMSDAPK